MNAKAVHIPGPLLAFGGLMLLFFLFLIGAAFCPVTKVPTGSVGIETWYGAVTGRTFPEGISWVNPLSAVTKLDLRIQTHTEEYGAGSQDSQAVNVSVVDNISIDSTKAALILQTIGLTYMNTIVVPSLQEAVKANVAKHKASEILGQREELKDQIFQALRTRVQPYGIIVHEISIAHISFSEGYSHAIEEKQKVEQQSLQKQYELNAANTEAQIAIAKAQGEASAARLRADALAYTNEHTSNTITDKLIAMEYLKKWQGTVPQFVGAGSPNLLMQIPGMSK